MASSLLHAFWCPLLSLAVLAGLLWAYRRRTAGPGDIAHLPGWLEAAFLWVTEPLVNALSTFPWAPTCLNVLGLVLSCLAGILYARAHPELAGMSLLAAGLCDTLDGRVARRLKAASRRGAFTDSVLDRYSEICLYSGLAWWLRDGIGLWLSWAALLSSLMVSYTRARAEGLGYSMREGLMQRPQRLAILIVASLFSPLGSLAGQGAEAGILLAGLWIIAPLSALTAVQRFAAGLWALGEEKDG